MWRSVCCFTFNNPSKLQLEKKEKNLFFFNKTNSPVFFKMKIYGYLINFLKAFMIKNFHFHPDIGKYRHQPAEF